MQYKFAKEQQDYSDYSSGRVFYSLPGHPAFPVRLASEIFQRCVAYRERIYGNSSPYTLYDPCCGAAYHLSVLAYLHGEHIQKVIASDIDEKAVSVAERNLRLLSIDGLEKRIYEISKLFETYGKESHQEALKSAAILKKKLSVLTAAHRLGTKVFQASAIDSETMLENIQSKSIDIVFTDVPYGRHSQWLDFEHTPFSNPLGAMLDALLDLLSSSSIVAIASDKQQKPSHENFQRLEQFQVGKRRVVILKPI
jgi:23S rRNA (guanine2535-N1)-methyltransferase